jgi:hypothetical protein
MQRLMDYEQGWIAALSAAKPPEKVPLEH